MCGHATIAAHYVRALEHGVPARSCRQLTGAGVQRIETLAVDGGFRIAIEQNRPTFAPPLAPELAAEVAAALGVGTDALDPRCPVQFVSTGHGKLLVGLRDCRQLQALVPDPGRLIALGPAVGSNGFFVFRLDTAPGDDAFSHDACSRRRSASAKTR